MSKVAYSPNIWGGPLPASNLTLSSTASSSGSGDYIRLNASNIYLSGTVIGPVSISGTFTQYGGFAYLGAFNSAGSVPIETDGLAVSWNNSNGHGEVDLWDTFPLASPAGRAAFTFKQIDGLGSYRDLGSISARGGFVVGGNFANGTQLSLTETLSGGTTNGEQVFFSKTETSAPASGLESQLAMTHSRTGGTGNREQLHLEINSNTSGGTAGEYIGCINALAYTKTGIGSNNLDAFAGVFTAKSDASLPNVSLVAQEVDIIALGNVERKVGLQVVDIATSVGAGTDYDAGIVIGKQAGGRGFNYAIQFGFSLGDAAPELNNGFLYCPTGTIPYAIDFSGVTFSTAAWKGAFKATGKISTNGGSIGYATGAGGSVTQLTNKSTAVTINKVCGQIITDSATLNANTSVTFTVNNTQHGADDVVVLSYKGETTPGSYLMNVCAINTNSFAIHIRNITAGNLSEALSINFAIINCVVS